MWIGAAVLSAFFAGITAVLAKCGIRKTDSDVATALRTVVVLIFSWVMVFLVGSQKTIGEISGKSLVFLVMSGLSTGESRRRTGLLLAILAPVLLIVTVALSGDLRFFA